VGLRQVALATTLALAGATLVTSPAHARRAPEPLVRDGDHFPVSITTDVPAGGTSMITTPTLSQDVKKLTVTVQPKNHDAIDGDIYDQFTHTLGSLSKGKRLLVCTMMYQSLVAPQDSYTDEFEVNAFFATIAGAVLLACLQMAGLLENKRQARSSSAATGCAQLRPSLPASVEQVSGGYSVEASGTTKKARRPKVKVSCRATGDKMTYTMRAAKKGVPLRKVAGKKISIGMKSPSDASKSVPVKVTFATR
jgi:hypothetical protein